MKHCQEGNHEVPNLFWRGTKERKSACAQCARKYAKPISKTIKAIDSNKPLNKTLQSTKKNKSIPKVSKNMQESLRLYKSVRMYYLLGHPTCEAQVTEHCSIEATDIHHQKGRSGKLLTDMNFFVATCRSCHLWIESHPTQAKELGLSLDRLTK